MSKTKRILISGLAVAAMAAVPAFADKPASPGKSQQEHPGAGHTNKGKHTGQTKSHTNKGKGHKAHNVAWIFKGTYNADGTVRVTRGNSRVRKGGFYGKDVAFDFSAAKFSVADTNGDGKHNLADVQTGDKVVVQAKLPRKNPGAQPFKARKLTDQTHPREHHGATGPSGPTGPTGP